MTSPARVPVATVPSASKPRRRMAMTLGFQLRAVFPVVLFGALFALLTLIVVWIPLNRQANADPSPVIKELLSTELFKVELYLAPLLLVSAGIAATAALLHARRMAGPVQQVREALAKISLGEMEPIKLQKRDEFRELEAPLNAVVSRMDYSQKNTAEMLRLLKRNLDGIAQRSANRQLSEADLRESIAVLMRDIDTELKKLQVKA